MFDCFKDVGDKCTDLEKNIETALEMGRREAPAGTTIPSYKQTKTFVMTECPKFPKGKRIDWFHTINSCILQTSRAIKRNNLLAKPELPLVTYLVVYSFVILLIEYGQFFHRSLTIAVHGLDFNHP